MARAKASSPSETACTTNNRSPDMPKKSDSCFSEPRAWSYFSVP